MRNFLIAVLLTSVAASPALAQDSPDRESWHRGGGDRREQSSQSEQTRQDRQQAHEELRAEQPRAERQSPPQVEMRRQAIEPGVHADAIARANRQDIDQVRAARQSGGGFDPNRAQRAGGVSRWTRDDVQQAGEASRWTRDPDQRAGETSRWTRTRERSQGGAQETSNDRVERSVAPGGWTRTRNGWSRATGGDFRQSDRSPPNVMRARNPLVVSTVPREGTQPPLRVDSRRHSSTNWSAAWRHNSRYDWRGWRDQHRSTFHVGLYYDPFGWGYQQYQIGWRLWPSYYGSRYWINDPWQYRLPYAPPGTVWVRYWDDAVLVDTFTGEVIDVIHNFFW